MYENQSCFIKRGQGTSFSFNFPRRAQIIQSDVHSFIDIKEKFGTNIIIFFNSFNAVKFFKCPDLIMKQWIKA